MRRITYLDGLRGVASVMVVLEHYVQAFSPRSGVLMQWFANGEAAVHLFFLMSGLVLTPSFERCPNEFLFSIMRRMLRLGIPAFVAVLCAIIAVYLVPNSLLPAMDLAGSKVWPGLEPRGEYMRMLSDLSGLTILVGAQGTTLFGFLRSGLLAAIQGHGSNLPIWSLHVEFWGSILVIALVYFLKKMPKYYPAALVVVFMICGNNVIILFPIGHILALWLRQPRYKQIVQNRVVSVISGAMVVLIVVFFLWKCHHLQVS